MTTVLLRSFLLAAALAASAMPTQAQVVLTGRVVDSEGVPVPFVNVQLLAASDSVLVGGTTARDDGTFALRGIKPERYLLHVSLVGYEPHVSRVDALDGQPTLDVGALILHQQTIEMEGVAVEARREFYEQRGDRLVVNVSHSVTLTGQSALEVLKQSPGVIVNEQSGTVSLLGKDGVRVMINGKLSYIPADGLVQYLAGMSADNIESIELITSPPAEFDAEGNAGYINIVMEQHPDDGLNGSMSVSAGWGNGELGSASTSIDYRSGGLTVYGSYSFLWDGRDQRFANLRRVTKERSIIETPTITWREPVQRNHNIRLGITLERGRTTLGALVGAYDNRWSMDALNRVTIYADDTPLTRIDSDNDEVNHWRHAMANISLQHELTAVSTFGLDIDYLYYRDDNPTDYLNTTTDLVSGEVTKALQESDKLTPLHLLVARADYKLDGGNSWGLGAGVKGAFSRFVNDVDFESLVQDQWLTEAGLDSRSELREDVLAAYGAVDYQPSEASSLTLGLRYELTDTNLGSDAEDDLVDRRFGSLFPSVSYSHEVSASARGSASYTRRITRPSFNDMAPFLYFLDPYTFFSGNAALQPAIINTIKLDLSYRSLLVSLGHAWEDSSIARFQSRLVPGTNVQVMSPMNFSSTRSTTALVALPVQFTGWWSTQNNVMVTWQTVEGFRAGQPATVDRESFRVSSTQNVSLPYDFDLEVSGFYQSAYLFGATRFDPTWRVNIGLQRALPGNRGKLIASMNDVFNSFKWSGTMSSPDRSLYIRQVFDFSNPTFQLTYSRRFGEAQATKDWSTASDEERARVQ